MMGLNRFTKLNHNLLRIMNAIGINYTFFMIISGVVLTIALILLILVGCTTIDKAFLNPTTRRESFDELMRIEDFDVHDGLLRTPRQGVSDYISDFSIDNVAQLWIIIIVSQNQQFIIGNILTVILILNIICELIQFFSRLVYHTDVFIMGMDSKAIMHPSDTNINRADIAEESIILFAFIIYPILSLFGLFL